MALPGVPVRSRIHISSTLDAFTGRVFFSGGPRRDYSFSPEVEVPARDAPGPSGAARNDTEGAGGAARNDTEGAGGAARDDTKGAGGAARDDTEGAGGAARNDTKGAGGAALDDDEGDDTGYSPTSPSYDPTAPSYSPTSPSYNPMDPTGERGDAEFHRRRINSTNNRQGSETRKTTAFTNGQSFRPSRELSVSDSDPETNQFQDGALKNSMFLRPPTPFHLPAAIPQAASEAVVDAGAPAPVVDAGAPAPVVSAPNDTVNESESNDEEDGDQSPVFNSSGAVAPAPAAQDPVEDAAQDPQPQVLRTHVLNAVSNLEPFGPDFDQQDNAQPAVDEADAFGPAPAPAEDNAVEPAPAPVQAEDMAVEPAPAPASAPVGDNAVEPAPAPVQAEDMALEPPLAPVQAEDMAVEPAPAPVQAEDNAIEAAPAPAMDLAPAPVEGGQEEEDEEDEDIVAAIPVPAPVALADGDGDQVEARRQARRKRARDEDMDEFTSALLRRKTMSDSLRHQEALLAHGERLSRSNDIDDDVRDLLKQNLLNLARRGV